jgi:uncharacterized membrane protein YkvA (DUF1232 family)
MQQKPSFMQIWTQRLRLLKREVYAVYLAMRDPRTPWVARLLAGVVVAYAFSPIDLIPDPIPVLGYLDDLLLIPLGIALVLKLIPAEVMEECRQHAQQEQDVKKPVSWVGAALVISLWLAAVGLVAFFVYQLIR